MQLTHLKVAQLLPEAYRAYVCHGELTVHHVCQTVRWKVSDRASSLGESPFISIHTDGWHEALKFCWRVGERGPVITAMSKDTYLATFTDPFNTANSQPSFTKTSTIHQNTALALWEDLLKTPKWNVWFYLQKCNIMGKREKKTEREKKTKANKIKEKVRFKDLQKKRATIRFRVLKE